MIAGRGKKLPLFGDQSGSPVFGYQGLFSPCIGHEIYHCPSSAKVTNLWTYTSVPHVCKCHKGEVCVDVVKPYTGSRGIIPLICNVGTRRNGWVGNFASCLLCSGKNYKYPLNRRLGGPNSRSGRFGGKKKSLACARYWSPDHSVPVFM